MLKVLSEIKKAVESNEPEFSSQCFFLQGIETNVFHSGRQFTIFTLPTIQRVYPPTFALSLIIVFYYKKKLESNKIK